MKMLSKNMDLKELCNILYSGSTVHEDSENFDDHYTQHEIVFEQNEKFFRWFYLMPKDEMFTISDANAEVQEITEVRQVEKLVKTWVPVEDDS